MFSYKLSFPQHNSYTQGWLPWYFNTIFGLKSIIAIFEVPFTIIAIFAIIAIIEIIVQ